MHRLHSQHLLRRLVRQKVLSDLGLIARSSLARSGTIRSSIHFAHAPAACCRPSNDPTLPESMRPVALAALNACVVHASLAPVASLAPREPFHLLLQVRGKLLLLTFRARCNSPCAKQ